MSQYTITIDGYESGLTKEAVKQQFEEMWGSGWDDVTITVEEE